MGNPTRALQLKDEGNALLSQHKYKRAYEKYTQAIQEDNVNAVLYANRSACLMAMKRFMEALNDGKKATELDPSYGKGWIRLGAAADVTETWDQAVIAYQNALSLLPSTSNPSSSLSPAEQKQKEQFTAALTNAETQLRLKLSERKREVEERERGEKARAAPYVFDDRDDLNEGGGGAKDARDAKDVKDVKDGAVAKVKGKGGSGKAKEKEKEKGREKRPWMIAREMVQGAEKRGELRSSAFVIHSAHEEYAKGRTLLGNLKQTSAGAWTGKLGAVEALLKGILRDRRVFHLKVWDEYKRMEEQINFEDSELKGWTNSKLTPSQILDDVKTRLEEDGGWRTVRPTLNLTIQAWILRAFLTSRLYPNPLTANVKSTSTSASPTTSCTKFAVSSSDKSNSDSYSSATNSNLPASSTTLEIDWETALTMYNRAIETIEKAEEEWKDVKVIERGTVFRQWFLRGTKALRLEAFEKVCFARSRIGEDSKYPMSKLIELSGELVDMELINEHNPNCAVFDPGSQSSFYAYPMAQACATRAFCYEKSAKYHSKEEKEALERTVRASSTYLLALQGLPRDEELHFVYLYRSLNAAWKAHAPPNVIGSLLKSYNAHKSAMSKLWVHTEIAKSGIHEHMARVVAFHERVLGYMQEGILPPMPTDLPNIVGITHDV